jgi:hypothetical protein
VCRLEILYNNDWENRYTYNLNRNFIKPLKKLNGWELYEIPFITGDNEYTQLRFVAQGAYMTVMAAKEPSAYADIPDTHDEFEGLRPQRHNIVFDDGFPKDTWYSTENLRARAARKANAKKAENGSFGKSNDEGRFHGAMSSVEETLENVGDIIGDFGSKVGDVLENVFDIDKIKSRLSEAFKSADVNEDVDVDDVVEDVVGGIMDGFTGEIDGLIDEIVGEVENSLCDVKDAIDDVKDAADDDGEM